MNENIALPEEFQPLKAGELHETRGGILAALATGLLIAAGVAIINDWDNFKAGLRGLPEIK
jgi:hypothetical protein